VTRVVFLHEYLPQYRVRLFELLREKSQSLGIDLVVAAGQPNSVQKRPGDTVDLDWVVPIHQREYRVLGRRLTVRSTRRLVDGADLVVMGQARRNLDLYWTLLRPGRPVVALWGHGADRVKKTSASEATLSRWLLAKSDWFFAYTDGAASAIIRQGFNPDHITVLNNSIDTSTLQAAIATLDPNEQAELERGFDLRGKTALYIGALDTYKRTPMLIDSAVAAHNREPNFRLIIAGDGVERAMVETAAESHSFIHYVGPKFGDGKASLLALADILISSGSVGLSVIDSFAARVPMVTTEWPFHGPEAEYLEHGKNAVITTDSVEAFVSGMLETLDDLDVMARLRANCAADSKAYSIEDMSATLWEGIQRALGVAHA